MRRILLDPIKNMTFIGRVDKSQLKIDSSKFECQSEVVCSFFM